MKENKIIIKFLAIAFSFAWLLWGTVIYLKLNFMSIAGLTLTLLGAFAPSIAAIVCVGKGFRKKFLKSFVSLNFGYKTYLAMFIVLPLTAIFAWRIPELFGYQYLPPLMAISIFPIYFLLMVFVGGGQEEIGWRGYLMKFLEDKYGLFFGGLILGIIWLIWHLPLWFIYGSSQSFMPFIAFAFLTIGYSFFFSWIIEFSGGRLFAGMFVHGLANSLAPFFPFLNLQANTQPRFWIYALSMFIIGLIIVLFRTSKNRTKTTKKS
ncbi:MAG: CPBP family intramembrane metalloprotease [Alphaproteobacteria bacterium]|jgi:membrane protease YdiL (CAAX protease family)|nr:CPBP family intramembrane metalloprotease [Alphaproteobacteria bacterium]